MGSRIAPGTPSITSSNPHIVPVEHAVTAEQPAELAPEVEPLVLAVLESRVKAAKAAARVPLEKLYAEGESRKIRSPLDGALLGVVLRTSPDARWQITDRTALDAHLADDPANIEYVDELAVEGTALVAALRELAPELLVRVERVASSARAAAVLNAQAGEEPLPGVGQVKPSGVLTVRPDKGAGAAIERLVRAGLIRIDGRPVELPAVVEDVAS